MVGSGTQKDGASVYYRFEDSTGRVHIVQSLSEVPEARRAHAQRVEYGQETALPSFGSTAPRPAWEMFGLGFAAALLAVLLYKWLPGTFRLALRLALIGGVIALLAFGYFGWIRRATGQSSATLAGPGALIDDAKSAVDKMNARLRAQDEQLKEIEKEK